jgi:integrase
MHGLTKPVTTSAKTEKPEINMEMDWCGKSKAILRQLVTKLKTVCKKQIRTPDQKTKAFQFIEQSIQAADRLEPNQKSALHLALFWIRDYLGTHDITASTIDAYFKRAFINGLLNFGDSYDLQVWDVEDHELAIEAMLDRPRLGEKSKLDIIDVLKKVYPFAEKHSFCENVDINFSIDGWTASSTRPEIIGLHYFDALLRILIQRNSRHDLEKAAALILGFYGGLRSSEVSKLTMNDVVALDGELNVEIHNSKSPAGRRRVPLHMLAPADACKTVEKLYENRLSEFREKSISRQLILKNIPLFGSNRSRDHYSSRSLANTCIAELKRYLGQDFVFHSLRHSFASWLLVRWYAARYPDIIETLAEGYHSLFGEESQKNLCQFFTSEREGEIPDDHASDLVAISKLIGHSGQETLFSTYIHSFHVIHKHAMKRASETLSAKKLSGNTISAIVPKMKSRHSHQRLPSRAINDICDYLNHTEGK